MFELVEEQHGGSSFDVGSLSGVLNQTPMM